MKYNRLYLAPLLAGGLLWGCSSSDDDNNLTPDPSEDPITEYRNTESEYVRLVVMADNNQTMVMNPVRNEITRTVEAPLTEGARYYVSNSGQYITSIERVEGQVRFFDTGIINHKDHGHDEAARWLDKVVSAPRPTHYSATGEHIVIFNDGDGSISHIEESRLEFPAYQPKVIMPENTFAYHGAAVRLNSGLFAVTHKEAGTPGSLPQTVKLFNDQGQVQHENADVRVTGIHGDASNGKVGLFGSTNGIIVADNNNDIRLIAHPANLPLRDTSGFWMGTVKGHDRQDVFYGWARQLGIFRIDPVANTITAFYEGNDVRNYHFSADGQMLIVETRDNRVRVYSAGSGGEMANNMVNMARPTMPQPANELEMMSVMNDPDPVLSASAKFLYVLEPSRNKVSVYRLSDLQKVTTLDLGRQVSHTVRVGFHLNR